MSTNKRITRKQIEAEFPLFKIIKHRGNYGYSVLFKPWNVQNCCILRGYKLDGIRDFVKRQNADFEKNGTFNRSYFRKE